MIFLTRFDARFSATWPNSSAAGLPAWSPLMMHEKISTSHLARRAVIYVRQSTLEQVATNLESQRRQYALRDRAVELVLRHWRGLRRNPSQSGPSTTVVGFYKVRPRRVMTAAMWRART
jgi:hypothetical protein